jgi:hypothetical protein
MRPDALVLTNLGDPAQIHRWGIKNRPSSSISALGKRNVFDSNAVNFTVTVDIPDDIVPPGIRPHEAVYRVTRPLEAMPGAGMVSVDYSGLLPPGLCCISRAA